MKRRRLYHARSGNSLRAAIAIELAGIDVQRTCLDLAAAEHQTPAFLKLNPAAAVPVYVEETDGEPAFVLTQSAAIAEYVLRAARPELFPCAAIDAARVSSAVHAAVGDIAVQNGLMRYLSFSPESVAFLQARFVHTLRASLRGLHAHRHVCGAQMTVADVAHYPVVHMRRPMLVAFGGSEHVLAWADRMRDLAPVARAIAYAGIELPFEGRP